MPKHVPSNPDGIAVGLPGRSLGLAAFIAQNGPLDRFVAFGDRPSPLRHRHLFFWKTFA